MMFLLENLSFLFYLTLSGLLIWVGWRLRLAWKKFLLRLIRRRGRKGEEKASSILKKNGYKILKRESSNSWTFYVDGKPVKFKVRFDFVVERDGKTFIAEVKTGMAADEKNSSTRRQLFEYAGIMNHDTILLVDATKKEIKEVRFRPS